MAANERVGGRGAFTPSLSKHLHSIYASIPIQLFINVNPHTGRCIVPLSAGPGAAIGEKRHSKDGKFEAQWRRE